MHTGISRQGMGTGMQCIPQGVSVLGRHSLLLSRVARLRVGLCVQGIPRRGVVTDMWARWLTGRLCCVTWLTDRSPGLTDRTPGLRRETGVQSGIPRGVSVCCHSLSQPGSISRLTDRTPGKKQTYEMLCSVGDKSIRQLWNFVKYVFRVCGCVKLSEG